MNFSRQSFGALLFSLHNGDLKKEIRNIEKMNTRLIHIKSGINFTDICLKEGLQPTFTIIYIYIYIYTHTHTQSIQLGEPLL